MDRDPLALPGEPGYVSGPDSDIEEVRDDQDVELEVELVPADIDYVKKLTGSCRGRKRKEVTTVENANKRGRKSKQDTNFRVQVIPSTDEESKENSESEEEEEKDEEFVVGDSRGRKKGKLGRPKKKKKKVIENLYKKNLTSTHHSRQSRYQQLQEKKDEFLQKQQERIAAKQEKHQKRLELGRKMYHENKTTEKPKKEQVLLPHQKKLYRKISMLALKITKFDKSKSREELVKEMADEWKANREKFWENYKKRWKDVSVRSIKPMTEERAEFLRKRGQKVDKIKQDQLTNRVTTRNKNKKPKNGKTFLDSSENSMEFQQEEDSEETLDADEAETTLDADESFVGYEFADNDDDEEFVAEEESFHQQNHDFVLEFTNHGHENHMFMDYQTNLHPDEMSAYFEENAVVEGFEGFQDEEAEIIQLNGYS